MNKSNLRFILALVLTFSATAFYCGNDPYDTITGKCICDNLSCCTPQPYPNDCCQNSTLPLPNYSEWILVDTNDPNNTVNAHAEMAISYYPGIPYRVEIPWFNVPQGPTTITYNFTMLSECETSTYMASMWGPYPGYEKPTIQLQLPSLTLSYYANGYYQATFMQTS